MRYAQYIVTGALIWAMTACAPKPSQEFIQSVKSEYEQVSKSLNDAVAGLEGELGKLQDPFASLKAELGKVWTDKVEKDKAITERIAKIAAEVEQRSTTLNTLKGEANSLLSEAQAFVDGLASQQKKDEELKGEWEALKGKITEKQNQISALSSELEPLRTEITAITEEIKKKYAPKK